MSEYKQVEPTPKQADLDELNDVLPRFKAAAQPAPGGRWQQRDPGLWYFIDDGGMEWNIPSEVHDKINALEAEVVAWKSLRPGWDITEVDKALQDGEAARRMWQELEAEVALWKKAASEEAEDNGKLEAEVAALREQLDALAKDKDNRWPVWMRELQATIADLRVKAEVYEQVLRDIDRLWLAEEMLADYDAAQKAHEPTR